MEKECNRRCLTFSLGLWIKYCFISIKYYFIENVVIFFFFFFFFFTFFFFFYRWVRYQTTNQKAMKSCNGLCFWREIKSHNGAQQRNNVFIYKHGSRALNRRRDVLWSAVKPVLYLPDISGAGHCPACFYIYIFHYIINTNQTRHTKYECVVFLFLKSIHVSITEFRENIQIICYLYQIWLLRF